MLNIFVEGSYCQWEGLRRGIQIVFVKYLYQSRTIEVYRGACDKQTNGVLDSSKLCLHRGDSVLYSQVSPGLLLQWRPKSPVLLIKLIWIAWGNYLNIT